MFVQNKLDQEGRRAMKIHRFDVFLNAVISNNCRKIDCIKIPT